MRSAHSPVNLSAVGLSLRPLDAKPRIGEGVATNKLSAHSTSQSRNEKPKILKAVLSGPNTRQAVVFEKWSPVASRTHNLGFRESRAPLPDGHCLYQVGISSKMGSRDSGCSMV